MQSVNENERKNAEDSCVECLNAAIKMMHSGRVNHQQNQRDIKNGVLRVCVLVSTSTCVHSTHHTSCNTCTYVVKCARFQSVRIGPMSRTHTHTRSMPCENQRESTANYTIITLFHMHHFFSPLFDNLAFSLCAVVFSLSLGLSSHSMQIHHFEIECKSVHTLFQSLVSVPVNCLVYTDTLMLFAKESNSYAKFKS